MKLLGFLTIALLGLSAMADDEAWKKYIIDRIRAESNLSQEKIAEANLTVTPVGITSLDRVTLASMYGGSPYEKGLVQWCKVEVTSDALNLRKTVIIDRVVRIMKKAAGAKKPELERGISDSADCASLFGELAKLKKDDERVRSFNVQNSEIVGALLNQMPPATTQVVQQNDAGSVGTDQ